MVATVPPGRGREGGHLGGAHERAAHDDSFAARRDVRELLFDVALVDGAVALEDALALRRSSLYNRDVAARDNLKVSEMLTRKARSSMLLMSFIGMF